MKLEHRLVTISGAKVQFSPVLFLKLVWFWGQDGVLKKGFNMPLLT